MLHVIADLKTMLAAQFRTLYGLDLDVQNVQIETPQNEKFGDYSTNIAMTLAGELNKNPHEIAADIVKSLIATTNSLYPAIFDKIEIAGPGFINFYYSKNWLQNLTKYIKKDSTKYGSYTPTPSKILKIALEHSNVNPNKAPHIGHLRNAVLGQFIQRVNQFLGHTVKVQYYSNDIGVQVATTYLGYKLNSSIKESNYDKFDYFAWDLYAEISQKIHENPELKEHLDKILKQIEDPNSVEAHEIKELSDKILHCQIATFNELDIDYDVVIHERDIVYLKMWERCFELLKQSPNFYYSTEGKSEGCWLLKTENSSSSYLEQTDANKTANYEVDKIIVRSNGVPTYTGKDIAYHMWKFGLLGMDFEYKVLPMPTQDKKLMETTSSVSSLVGDVQHSFSNSDKVIDVIDQKQTYAINVVKESLNSLGFIDAYTNMHHVNYGFVYLSPKTAQYLGLDVSDSKDKYEMSGRKGQGVKVGDLIDMVDSKLKAEFGNFEALTDVRNGALKFEMLKTNTFNDLVFDIDTALNIKGFSGPYIQYTHARICSILNKASLEDIEVVKSINTALNNNENNQFDLILFNLMSNLAKFDEIIQRSSADFAPNILADYLFKVSKIFNTFYNDVPILSTEDRNTRLFRLEVCFCTRIVLSNGLEILGINAPEKI